MALLGIDIGGTKLLARGVTRSGTATGFAVRCATGRGLGPAAALALIADVVERARVELAAHGGVEAIGVGFPGLVDHRGVAQSSVMLDGWSDVPLAAALEDRFGVPCAVDNDVNTAAVWEQHRSGARDFLLVAVGTGIGGALVLDGQLRRGGGGFAGEIGHVSIDRDGTPCLCGRRGCVNRYASGTAIEEAAGLAPGALQRLTAGELQALAPVTTAAAEALGVAIGSALNLLDVPVVVLSGGVAEALGPRYRDAVAARARRECFAGIGDACHFALARPEGAALGAAVLAGQRGDQPASRASASSASTYSRASRPAADG